MSLCKHVCIVTSSALGSNPRVVKEANALEEAGYKVTVVSVRSLDLVDKRDNDILATERWRAMRLDMRNRYRRLLYRGFQKLWESAYAYTGDIKCAEKGLSVCSRLLTAIAMRVQADLYIAHYPPALPAVALAAKRYCARYAFDAEDFHLGDLPETPQHALQRQMIRAVEERYLPGASYVTAASPGIADAYAREYPIKQPEVVLNVFPLSHAPTNATHAGRSEPRPSVYWFSQTIGADRGLECAVRAISQAKSFPHLYLRGALSGAYMERLKSIAAEVGVEQRLHILAPAPPSKMERLAANYDMGFVGETGLTKNRQIALTNKLFSYFLAGIPAVISDIPAHRAIAADLGEAVRLYAVDDCMSLAAGFDDLLANAGQLATARDHAFRLGQTRFNWDTEKPLFLETVAECLAEKRKPL